MEGVLSNTVGGGRLAVKEVGGGRLAVKEVGSGRLDVKEVGVGRVRPLSPPPLTVIDRHIHTHYQICRIYWLHTIYITRISPHLCGTFP